MKFFLISDNVDTLVGMRLAGITGVVVHTREDTLEALDGAFADEENAIVLITDRLTSLCRDEVYGYKLTRHRPLIVTIPDRHGSLSVTESIDEYVREAIGIRI